MSVSSAEVGPRPQGGACRVARVREGSGGESTASSGELVRGVRPGGGGGQSCRERGRMCAAWDGGVCAGRGVWSQARRRCWAIHSVDGRAGGGIIGGCPGGSKEVRLALPVCGGVGEDSELARCVGVRACAQSCRERRRI